MIAGTSWKVNVLKNCAAVGVLGLLPGGFDADDSTGGHPARRGPVQLQVSPQAASGEDATCR